MLCVRAHHARPRTKADESVHSREDDFFFLKRDIIIL